MEQNLAEKLDPLKASWRNLKSALSEEYASIHGYRLYENNVTRDDITDFETSMIFSSPKNTGNTFCR